jgi:hypothetical protein
MQFPAWGGEVVLVFDQDEGGGSGVHSNSLYYFWGMKKSAVNSRSFQQSGSY